nr:LysR substrate-binding domain-containing protein [Pseudomonas marginalis]
MQTMLIEAALAGLGVALVPRIYVEAELSQCRLVAPWPQKENVPKTFCLVLPQSLELSQAPTQAFARWLLTAAHVK